MKELNNTSKAPESKQTSSNDLTDTIVIIIGAITVISVVLAFFGINKLYSGTQPGDIDDLSASQINTTQTPHTAKNDLSGGCITPEEAADRIGEEACVVYRVGSAFLSDKGNCFLWDEVGYPTGFSTVIFSENTNTYRPCGEYENRPWLARGTIEEYRQSLQIIVGD